MSASKARARIFLAWAVVALLIGLSALPVAAHFLLNANIRIVHIEHVEDGLRVYLRLPTPYVLAGLVGERRADGSVPPAPFTTNRMEDGQLLHSLDLAAIKAEPLGLGRLAADGHVLALNDQPIRASVEAVRLHLAIDQAPFATLPDAKASMTGSLVPDGLGDTYVGDTVLDVRLFYRTDGEVTAFSFASTLDPGLDGQENTANLVIDHAAGESLVFREAGLLADPIAISRSTTRAALTFVVEGIKHILGGTDHVLFVVCITIGAVGLGNLMWRVTGFTLGHTVTLIAGFFGFVPAGAWFIPTIETGIALSIIYVAVIAMLDKPSAGTFFVTAAIGLLHGLGFSFLLQEILRVDAPNLWQSLVSFNVGVELGQLAIVLVVWPVFLLLAKWGAKPLRLGRYGVAVPCILVAGIWTVQRVQMIAETVS
jgi:hypothetical protein